jgi:hypothetical protein
MKQATLLAMFIIAAQLCFSRNPHAAGATATPDNDSLSVSSMPSMQEMLTQIMNVTGLHANFELKQAKVMNIEASISHRKRYILYNTDFINQIHKATHDKWSTIALLAHEVGHHLNGHTISKSGSTPALELEADEFAGFILYKLGANLQQTQEVMNYIAQPEGSSSYPSRMERMLAMQRGWERAMRE